MPPLTSTMGIHEETNRDENDAIVDNRIVGIDERYAMALCSPKSSASVHGMGQEYFFENNSAATCSESSGSSSIDSSLDGNDDHKYAITLVDEGDREDVPSSHLRHSSAWSQHTHSLEEDDDENDTISPNSVSLNEYDEKYNSELNGEIYEISDSSSLQGDRYHCIDSFLNPGSDGEGCCSQNPCRTSKGTNTSFARGECGINHYSKSQMLDRIFSPRLPCGEGYVEFSEDEESAWWDAEVDPVGKMIYTIDLVNGHAKNIFLGPLLDHIFEIVTPQPGSLRRRLIPAGSFVVSEILRVNISAGTRSARLIKALVSRKPKKMESAESEDIDCEEYSKCDSDEPFVHLSAGMRRKRLAKALPNYALCLAHAMPVSLPAAQSKSDTNAPSQARPKLNHVTMISVRRRLQHQEQLEKELYGQRYSDTLAFLTQLFLTISSRRQHLLTYTNGPLVLYGEDTADFEDVCSFIANVLLPIFNGNASLFEPPPEAAQGVFGLSLSGSSNSELVPMRSLLGGDQFWLGHSLPERTSFNEAENDYHNSLSDGEEADLLEDKELKAMIEMTCREMEMSSLSLADAHYASDTDLESDDGLAVEMEKQSSDMSDILFCEEADLITDSEVKQMMEIALMETDIWNLDYLDAHYYSSASDDRPDDDGMTEEDDKLIWVENEIRVELEEIDFLESFDEDEEAIALELEQMMLPLSMAGIDPKPAMYAFYQTLLGLASSSNPAGMHFHIPYLERPFTCRPKRSWLSKYQGETFPSLMNAETGLSADSTSPEESVSDSNWLVCVAFLRPDCFEVAPVESSERVNSKSSILLQIEPDFVGHSDLNVKGHPSSALSEKRRESQPEMPKATGWSCPGVFGSCAVEEMKEDIDEKEPTTREKAPLNTPLVLDIEPYTAPVEHHKLKVPSAKWRSQLDSLIPNDSDIEESAQHNSQLVPRSTPRKPSIEVPSPTWRGQLTSLMPTYTDISESPANALQSPASTRGSSFFFGGNADMKMTSLFPNDTEEELSEVGKIQGLEEYAGLDSDYGEPIALIAFDSWEDENSEEATSFTTSILSPEEEKLLAAMKDMGISASGSSSFGIEETKHMLKALATALALPGKHVDRLAETETKFPTPVVSYNSHAIVNSDLGPGFEFLVMGDSSHVEELETDLYQPFAKQTTRRSLKTNDSIDSERALYLPSILSIDRSLVSVEVEMSEDSKSSSSYGSVSESRGGSSISQDWKGECDKVMEDRSCRSDNISSRMVRFIGSLESEQSQDILVGEEFELDDSAASQGLVWSMSPILSTSESLSWHNAETRYSLAPNLSDILVADESLDEADDFCSSWSKGNVSDSFYFLATNMNGACNDEEGRLVVDQTMSSGEDLSEAGEARMEAFLLPSAESATDDVGEQPDQVASNKESDDGNSHYKIEADRNKIKGLPLWKEDHARGDTSIYEYETKGDKESDHIEGFRKEINIGSVSKQYSSKSNTSVTRYDTEFDGESDWGDTSLEGSEITSDHEDIDPQRELKPLYIDQLLAGISELDIMRREVQVDPEFTHSHEDDDEKDLHSDIDSTVDGNSESLAEDFFSSVHTPAMIVEGSHDISMAPTEDSSVHMSVCKGSTTEEMYSSCHEDTVDDKMHIVSQQNTDSSAVEDAREAQIPTSVSFDEKQDELSSCDAGEHDDLQNVNFDSPREMSEGHRIVVDDLAIQMELNELAVSSSKEESLTVCDEGTGSTNDEEAMFPGDDEESLVDDLQSVNFDSPREMSEVHRIVVDDLAIEMELNELAVSSSKEESLAVCNKGTGSTNDEEAMFPGDDKESLVTNLVPFDARQSEYLSKIISHESHEDYLSTLEIGPSDELFSQVDYAADAEDEKTQKATSHCYEAMRIMSAHIGFKNSGSKEANWRSAKPFFDETSSSSSASPILLTEVDFGSMMEFNFSPDTSAEEGPENNGGNEVHFGTGFFDWHDGNLSRLSSISVSTDGASENGADMSIETEWSESVESNDSDGSNGGDSSVDSAKPETIYFQFPEFRVTATTKDATPKEMPQANNEISQLHLQRDSEGEPQPTLFFCDSMGFEYFDELYKSMLGSTPVKTEDTTAIVALQKE